MNLLDYKNIYMVGIKGVAMTSLALCLQDLGCRVQGSDVEEEFVTEAMLKKRSIKVLVGFNENNISSEFNLVIYTGAHQGVNNPQVQKAIQLGIPVMSHAQALGSLIANKKLISVCGTGGKSTTSAMVAFILEKAGLAPSFTVGVGNVPNLGVSGRYVKDSAWFVAEADEYAVDPAVDRRPRFIFQKPQIIICTNLKYDHPDIYPSFEKMKEVFLDFFNTLPDSGKLIINADDKELLELVGKLTTKAKVVTVGTTATSDFYLHDFVVRDGRNICGVTYEIFATKEKVTKELQLGVPGAFNLMNAQMALFAATQCGVEDSLAFSALREFEGTMRRFEKKGEVNGALWYDDYAHTPDEISATLVALKTRHPDKKIIAIFQPHTYSRTKTLFDGFSRSFVEAQEVILLPIFASAREKDDPTVSSEMLAAAIRSEKDMKVEVMKMDEVAQDLKAKITSDHVVMTLGAGDVYKIFDQIKK